MADTKMSALPPVAALAGADIFAVEQGGVSKKASATQIATFTGGAGSAPPFTDATAIIMGSADNTKLLRIEVDGFTAGATRILTPPNANATIAGLQIAQTFTEVQTFTPADNLIPIVIAAGSVTGAGTSPFLNISGTWNTTGAPDAIRLTITDTASNAAANLIDLMVGAGSMFAVRKDGRATIAADALIAGATSPAITSIRVSVGAAAAQNVIRINGNSTADNAPVLDFLRSGNREWTMAPIGNSFFIGNSGGVANFNDATLNATPNWEFTSLGALKLNLGTVATGLLHVNTNTSGAGLTIFEQASADTDCFDLSFRKTRGTVAVPTVITVGDELGSIIFRGYSGAGGYVTGASIRAVSTGTIATTRVAASLVFATGTDAAPTVLTDRWQISNAGHLLPSTTAIYDIGASAGPLIRTLYANASVVAAGATYAGTTVTFSARTKLDGITNGNLILSNNAATDFNLLQFGGTTSSFPALKRSTVILQCKLADDSAFAAFNALDITANAGTAIPAGGTAGAGLKVSSTANFGVFFGSGAPSLSAAKGSLYLRSDGGGTGDRAYINTDGATAWTAITTAT